jgi:hypothetical protein
MEFRKCSAQLGEEQMLTLLQKTTPQWEIDFDGKVNPLL